MTYEGCVKNGVVVLGGKVTLPEGTVVRVEPIEPRPLNERFRDIIGRAPGLPPDMAEHHDYYIHGTPKD